MNVIWGLIGIASYGELEHVPPRPTTINFFSSVLWPTKSDSDYVDSSFL